MAIPRPKSGIKSFFAREWVYDTPFAIAALIPNGFALWKFWYDQQTGLAIFFLVWVIILGFGAFGKVVLKAKKEKRSESTHELEGCLQTLHAMLTHYYQGGELKLRITIHVPTDQNQRLLQVMNYVGDNATGHGAGRKFPAQSGVIGQAFRTKKLVVARRVNDDPIKYMQELVELHGYTPEDAAAIQPVTQAWLAMPIFETGTAKTIEGILYLDATDPKFFTQKRVKMIESASIGIALFIKQRYSQTV